MTPLRLALAALALAPFALAADPAPAEPAPPAGQTAAPASDYSAAFEKLYAFGLPDTRGLTFVKAENQFDRFMGQKDFVPALSGFAWRSADTDKRKTKVVVSGLAVFEGIGDSDDNNPFAAFAIFSAPDQFEPGAKFPSSIPLREADLKKEVTDAHARLLAWKESRAKNSGKNDPQNRGMSDWARREAPDRLAPYLILAAHAHRAGLTDEANRLAGLALSCADKPDAVAKAALTPLADLRWAAELNAWSRLPGASAEDLAKRLEGVSQRFAGGWKQAPAARHLLRQLRSAKPPAPPSLEGRTFTPEQLKFAADLLALREMPAESDWLTPGKADAKHSPVTESLRKMGVEALPLLAVLSEDTAPGVCIPKPDPQRGFQSFGMDDDDNNESQRRWREENAYRQWTMRPMTRGEIATALLRMPKGYCFDVNEEQSLADGVLVDYHTLKREGRLGMLLEKTGYAKNWNRQQVWKAVFDAVATDADAAKLEAALLENTGKDEVLRTTLRPYLARRGVKAAAFLEKFSAAARAEIDEQDDAAFAAKAKDGRFQMSYHMAGSRPPATKAAALADFDKRLEKLRPLVAEKSAQASSGDPLADILNEAENADGPMQFGGDDDSTPMGRLKAFVGENGNPWDKAIPAILERAAKIKDTKKRFTVLNLAQFLVFQGKNASAPTPEQIAKVMPACRAILAADGKSLSHRMGAFQTFEALFEGKRSFGMNSAMQALQHLQPEDSLRLMDARFNARADGKPLPEWPSASNVSAERLKAIVADLAAHPAELAARHAKLSLDEQVAWGAEITRNPEALTPEIAKARAKIIRILAEEEDAKAFVQSHDLASFVGRTTDAQTVRELFTRVIPKTPGKAFTLGTSQGAVGRILFVTGVERFFGLGMNDDGDKPKASAYFFRQSLSKDGAGAHENAQASFLLGAPSLDTPDTEKFWKSLDTPDDARVTQFHLMLTLPAAPEAAKEAKK